MIASLPAEIKIVIFQSISGRQYARWTKIVQFRQSCSTIFIFSPTLTQKLLKWFSQSFTRCRAISVASNACICKTIVHFVSEQESKERRLQYWRLQKSPKINCLPYQRPLDYCEIYVSFIIGIYTSTNAEILVKTGSVVVEIFGNVGEFWPICRTIFIFSSTLTQKLHRVSKKHALILLAISSGIVVWF